MVTAGATANTTVENSRASRESGLLSSHSHGESIVAAFGLTFTRYCHSQYCKASIAIQDGRGGTLYCAIVWAMKGWSGVPKQGGCLRIIVLILVYRHRTKRIYCKGQSSEEVHGGGKMGLDL